jgi:catechol 2,3-dioxygenase-like lactoylglutathione lyase family enzyme
MPEKETWLAAPVLRVRDVRKSVAYYVDKLGFTCPPESIHDGLGDEGATRP